MENLQASWKSYIKVMVESFLAIFIASFCVGMFLTHEGSDWMTQTIFLSVMYLFVIIGSIVLMARKLPIQVLMLLIPVAPLAILLYVVALLHVLQLLK